MRGYEIAELDHHDDTIAAQLAALQRAAYRIEAVLIGWDGIPGLTATTADVRERGGVRWLGSIVDGEIVGALCEERDGPVLGIDSLVVDPQHHRRGHGRALLTASLSERDITRWVVGTGEKNTPAVKLYQSFGFRVLEFDDATVPYVRYVLDKSN